MADDFVPQGRRINPFYPSNFQSQGQDPQQAFSTKELSLSVKFLFTSIPLGPTPTLATFSDGYASSSVGSSSYPSYPTETSLGGYPTPTSSHHHTYPAESYTLSSSTTSLPGSEPTNSPLPTYIPTQREHHSGLSPGAVAAAVVVPILALLALFLLAFFCVRRRRRAAAHNVSPDLPPVISEKKHSWGNSTEKPRVVAPFVGGPIITSADNNAYNTGLDTSSHGSQSIRGTSAEYYRHGARASDDFANIAEPPPPYNAKSRVSPPRSKRSTASSSPAPQLPPLVDIPALHEPSPSPPHSRPTTPLNEHDLIARGPSPFDDPPTPNQTHNAALYLNPQSRDPSRPETSRSNTARSFTSTLYSDSASVHSAREERVSFASPAPQSQQRQGQSQSQWQQWQHQRGASDPFADSRGGAVSPITPVENDERPLGGRPKSEGW